MKEFGKLRCISCPGRKVSSRACSRFEVPHAELQFAGKANGSEAACTGC